MTELHLIFHNDTTFGIHAELFDVVVVVCFRVFFLSRTTDERGGQTPLFLALVTFFVIVLAENYSSISCVSFETETSLKSFILEAK